MKEKMLKHLETFWAAGLDREAIESFIEAFCDQYQPERLSEKTFEENNSSEEATV